RLLLLFFVAAQSPERLEAPEGVQHVPVAACGRRGTVEAPVRAPPLVQILEELRAQVGVRQPEQSAAGEGHQLEPEDRVALPLVLPGVRRRLDPPEDDVTERRDVFPEPEQRLDLLVLEAAQLALQLLDVEGVPGPDELGQLRLPRNVYPEETVAPDRRVG